MPESIRRRAGAALFAGLLTWLGIYALELAWTLRDHPIAWVRAYFEAPIPWLIALYVLAGIVTAATRTFFSGMRVRRQAIDPAALRALKALGYVQ